MPSYTFIVAQLGKNAERRGETLFERLLLKVSVDVAAQTHLCGLVSVRGTMECSRSGTARSAPELQDVFRRRLREGRLCSRRVAHGKVYCARSRWQRPSYASLLYALAALAARANVRMGPETCPTGPVATRGGFRGLRSLSRKLFPLAYSVAPCIHGFMRSASLFCKSQHEATVNPTHHAQSLYCCDSRRRSV